MSARDGRGRRVFGNAVRMLLSVSVLAVAGCSGWRDLPTFTIERPTLVDLAFFRGGSWPVLDLPTPQSTGCDTQACVERVASAAFHDTTCGQDTQPSDTASRQCPARVTLGAYVRSVFGPEATGTAVAEYLQAVGARCEEGEVVVCTLTRGWCAPQPVEFGAFYHQVETRITIFIRTGSASGPIEEVLFRSRDSARIDFDAYRTCVLSGVLPL